MSAVKKSTATTNPVKFENDRALRGAEIQVVGAGIAGLCAAVALARRGADVQIFEQTRVIGEVGAGIQITPNGVAVLDAIGLGEPARDLGTEIEHVGLFDGLTGRGVAKIPVGQGKRPYLAFHRADLIELLMSGAHDAQVNLNLGAPITTKLDGSGLKVCADGIQSHQRAEMIESPPPKFSGHVAWRAIVPSYGKIAPLARIDMAPGKHVVTYPIRNGAALNVVAIEECDHWATESWSATGDPEIMCTRFGEMGGYVAEILGRIENVGHWGLFHRAVAPNWHDNQGRVLIGDAAHPTLPFMAQGANLALEDAWALACIYDPNSVNRSLQQFQDFRMSRVDRAIKLANGNARNYHITNPVMRRIAHAGLSTIDCINSRLLAQRFSWLYDYDVTAYADRS